MLERDVVVGTALWRHVGWVCKGESEDALQALVAPGVAASEMRCFLVWDVIGKTCDAFNTVCAKGQLSLQTGGVAMNALQFFRLLLDDKSKHLLRPAQSRIDGDRLCLLLNLWEVHLPRLGNRRRSNLNTEGAADR